MENMSMEQLAGQRMMVGFDGKEFNEDLKYLIGKMHIGGLILFSRNLGTPDQIRNLCSDCQSLAAECNQPPLFIAIDQEGGVVARLKPPFTQFPGNPSISSLGDAVHFAVVTAKELMASGINMNMAPVMDLSPEGIRSIMAERSFGADPFFVSRMGTAVIDLMQEKGIMAVAKHFPGIGRTVVDSHMELPDLDTTMADLEKTDLIPFKAAIDHQVAGIMLSHIRYTEIDPHHPASISPEITTNMLRKQLGYNGVVMTDDLDMGAIKQFQTIEPVMAHLLESDVDIAMICHKGPDIQTAYDTILRLCNKNPELLEMCRCSVERIMALKARYLSR